MILYTPLPLEQVLEGHDKPLNPPVEMMIEGKQFVVEPTGTGEGRIVRLLSTDPADFLDERFSPGGKVVFTGSFPAEEGYLT